MYYCNRAAARAFLNDDDGAKADAAKAVELDPSYAKSVFVFHVYLLGGSVGGWMGVYAHGCASSGAHTHTYTQPICTDAIQPPPQTPKPGPTRAWATPATSWASTSRPLTPTRCVRALLTCANDPGAGGGKEPARGMSSCRLSRRGLLLLSTAHCPTPIRQTPKTRLHSGRWSWTRRRRRARSSSTRRRPSSRSSSSARYVSVYVHYCGHADA